MSAEDVTLAVVVVTALFFDFTNGFHDTANSIATSVSTHALSPRLAVISSAILNFIGAFFFFAVAATIATGIVNPEAITLKVVLAGLVGAITWNLITWYLALPSSSSHALIGGIIGSSVAATGGFAVVNSNDLARGFERIMTDQQGYYLIGYQPNAGTLSFKSDQQFRRVKIKVKTKGLTIRTRAGFYGEATE